MTSLEEALHRWSWLLPLGAAGIYLGRLISELVRPNLPGALILTFIPVSLIMIIFRRAPIERTWPLFLVALYLLYPDADLKVGLSALVLVLLVAAVNETRKLSTSQDLLNLAHRLAALLLFIAFLTLYITTLAPGLLPADSGEFQLVAVELGVAHPTGFPLYTMLANLATRLPLNESPAYLVNIFSALTGALTLVFVYLSTQRLTGSIFGGLAAGLGLGSATTFWAQSTTANVRSLAALFTALAIYLVLLLRDLKMAIPERTTSVDEQNDSALHKEPWFLILIFLAVLGLGVTHHTSLAFVAFISLLFFLIYYLRLLRKPRMWLWVILAILICLLPLIYLPMRAAAGALNAPADLTTLRGFLNHVLALGFRGDFFYFSDLPSIWARLKVMANIMTFQFEPLLLAAMIIGFGLLLWRDRKGALLLGGIFGIMVIATATYRAPQSVEYLMPAYVAAAIMLGYAVGEAYKALPEDGIPPLLSLFAGVVLLSGLLQAINRYPSYAYLHNEQGTREYTQGLLEDAPPGAVILADWHWATPLWYLQTVEDMRPDVDIEFVNPADEPYAQTWARRIREEIDDGQQVIATHFNEEAYASLPLPDPLDEAFLYGAPPINDLPEGYMPASTAFGDSIEVVGFTLSDHPFQIGREGVVTLAWRPLDGYTGGENLFARLTDSEGITATQMDVPALAKNEGLTLTQLRLTPAPGAMPGDYDLLIGAYGERSIPDQLGGTSTAFLQVPIDLAAEPIFTSNPRLRPIAAADSDLTLIGYDWDNTLPGGSRLYLHWRSDDGYFSEVRDQLKGDYRLPATVGPWGLTDDRAFLRRDREQLYMPFGQGIVWSGRPFWGVSPEIGEELTLVQRFSASWPVDRDLVVSVRLVGYEEDGFLWAWWDLDDGVPAMGAIPTLKWIGGSTVYDPHHLEVSEQAEPGQVVSPLLRIYDAFSGRPLPILDRRVSQRAPWLSLGSGRVKD